MLYLNTYLHAKRVIPTIVNTLSGGWSWSDSRYLSWITCLALLSAWTKPPRTMTGAQTPATHAKYGYPKLDRLLLVKMQGGNTWTKWGQTVLLLSWLALRNPPAVATARRGSGSPNPAPDQYSGGERKNE